MTRTRVNELDLLRFFAALAVVFFHYSFRGYAADNMSVMPYPLLAPFSKYGHLGFELFFMISGFVILMTAASGSLRGFVVSRVVRLYPAFWACCTITFAVTIAIGAPRYSASISQYLVNMTLLSGFVGVPSIDGGYWSLFVEMQFYALVAVVLVIGRIHQAQLFLIFWLVASVALEILPMHVLRYLLVVDYSAFFIAGAVFFLIWSKGLTRARAAIIALSWGLAIFQSTNKLSGFEEHYNTSMSSCVVAGIISTFFVVMFLVSVKRTGKFGRRRWMLAGAVTYPLYLLHQNIGFMIFNIAYPAINPHLLLWGTIAAVLGAAFLVHILIEKRFSLPIKYAISDLADHMQHLMMHQSGRP
jgi:peptidoglycan/LPS O-acetylase OafA/YrhL